MPNFGVALSYFQFTIITHTLIVHTRDTLYRGCHERVFVVVPVTEVVNDSVK